jgi:hypothetical protein
VVRIHAGQCGGGASGSGVVNYKMSNVAHIVLQIKNDLTFL